MKIGIISLGGKSSLSIAEACKKYFREVDSLNIRNFEVHLTPEGINLTYGGKSLKDYDCLYIRGSHKYALLQRAITRVLSRKVYNPIDKEGFALGHDKFLTLVELQKQKIAIPSTYYAATTELAKQILEKEVKYPVIMKVPRGTHGKGVMVADSLASGKSILDLLEHFKEPYLIQEFVKTKSVSDIRAIVVGSKVVAAYERRAGNGELRANIHLGGERHKYTLSSDEEKLAVGSAKAIGADICGVDILNSKSPSVIEINLSPGIAAIEEVTGVDVSDTIAEFLHSQTLKFKEKKKRKADKKFNKIIE